MSLTSPPAPGSDNSSELHAALDREEDEYMRLRLAPPEWLRENPGLGLTIIYLFASLVGMLFHHQLLKRFGFNVLEFSETSDFLMVVVREPLAVVLALLGVPFYLVYGAVTRRLSRMGRRHIGWLRFTPERRQKSIGTLRRWSPLLQAGFIGIYAVLFVMVYSLSRANAIRRGDFQRVAVEFKTDSPRADGSLRAEGLALLGTSTRFVFLYDPATKRAEVLPLDAIARLVWDARSRRERQEAAPARP
jgi:hypothetical protein